MKVFISHSHKIPRWPPGFQGLCAKTVWRSGDPDADVFPGDNWAEKAARALEESHAVVLLLTPAAVNSPYVRREIEYALGAKRYSNRLIPVAIGAREELPADSIPWIVRRMPWVELEDCESGFPEVKPIAEAILSHV